MIFAVNPNGGIDGLNFGYERVRRHLKAEERYDTSV